MSFRFLEAWNKDWTKVVFFSPDKINASYEMCNILATAWVIDYFIAFDVPIYNTIYTRKLSRTSIRIMAHSKKKNWWSRV